jgi:hypothetical protein
MFNVGTRWNPLQQKLREALSKNGNLELAIQTCLELHGIVHASTVSSTASQTFMDEIWNGLTREIFSEPIKTKNGFGRKSTIAWNIWHITRIEDLTVNILVSGGKQILNAKWLKRLGVAATETGNAMSDAEIADFSKSVKPDVLQEYRNAVGSQTRGIVEKLTAQDMQRKVKKESLDRILREGGVVDDEKSIWLLDFWGRKNVGGILAMPVTRHQIVHLNECARIKSKAEKKIS